MSTRFTRFQSQCFPNVRYVKLGLVEQGVHREQASVMTVVEFQCEADEIQQIFVSK